MGLDRDPVGPVPVPNDGCSFRATFRCRSRSNGPGSGHGHHLHSKNTDRARAVDLSTNGLRIR